MSDGFRCRRAHCPGAVGGRRCGGHCAVDPAATDHGATIDDLTGAAAVDAAGAAGHVGRPRNGKPAERHPAQLLAYQLGPTDRRTAGTAYGHVRRTLRQHADDLARHGRALAAATGYSIVVRSAANSSGASIERHAAARFTSGTRQRERPLRRDSNFDQRHFDGEGSEGKPGFAGEDQCRAGHAAKRANQASGALPGDAGARIVSAAATDRAGDCRTGEFLDPLPTDSLRSGDLRSMTWDSSRRFGLGSTVSLPPTSAPTPRFWPPPSSLPWSCWRPSMLWPGATCISWARSTNPS